MFTSVLLAFYYQSNPDPRILGNDILHRSRFLMMSSLIFFSISRCFWNKSVKNKLSTSSIRKIITLLLAHLLQWYLWNETTIISFPLTKNINPTKEHSFIPIVIRKGTGGEACGSAASQWCSRGQFIVFDCLYAQIYTDIHCVLIRRDMMLRKYSKHLGHLRLAEKSINAERKVRLCGSMATCAYCVLPKI